MPDIYTINRVFHRRITKQKQASQHQPIHAVIRASIPNSVYSHQKSHRIMQQQSHKQSTASPSTMITPYRREYNTPNESQADRNTMICIYPSHP